MRMKQRMVFSTAGNELVYIYLSEPLEPSQIITSYE